MKMGNVGRWVGGLMIQIMDEDGKWMDEGRERELVGGGAFKLRVRV